MDMSDAPPNHSRREFLRRTGAVGAATMLGDGVSALADAAPATGVTALERVCVEHNKKMRELFHLLFDFSENKTLLRSEREARGEALLRHISALTQEAIRLNGGEDNLQLTHLRRSAPDPQRPIFGVTDYAGTGLNGERLTIRAGEVMDTTARNFNAGLDYMELRRARHDEEQEPSRPKAQEMTAPHLSQDWLTDDSQRVYAAMQLGNAWRGGDYADHILEEREEAEKSGKKRSP